MRRLGPLVKAPNTPKGQGKLADNRLQVVCQGSQYGLAVCGSVAGPIRYSMRPFRTHSSLRLTAPGANGGEVRPRTRTAAAGPLAGAPPAALPPSGLGPDRGRIGQGGDDPQAPATGRACAEVGGKHPRQQGRPPQPMGAGRSRSNAVRRRLLNRFGGTMRSRARARGPGPRGSAGDETGARGPEPPASPAVPSERAGDGQSHPTTHFFRLS